MEEKQPDKEQIFADFTIILLGNLLPIFGLIHFNWIFSDLAIILVFEAVIIGIFNILKMIFANSSENPWYEKLILAISFLLYHGFFIMFTWGIIFLFVLRFELLGTVSESDENMYYHLIDLINLYFEQILSFQYFISYAYLIVILKYIYSFVKNYWIEGERRKTDVRDLMNEPYKIIGIQLTTLFLGLFLIIPFQSLQIPMIIVIILKIIEDMYFHFLDRKKYLNVNYI